MKTKFNLRKIFIFALYLIIFIISTYAENADCSSCFNDIAIDNYEATLTLTDSGDMIVQEKYTYDYSGEYSAKYRDIGVMKYNSQNPITQSRNDTAYLADIHGYKLNESVDISSLVTVSVDGKTYTSVRVKDYYTNNNDNYVYVGVTGERDELGDVIGCDPYSSSCESIFVCMNRGNYFGNETIFTYNYMIKGAVTKYTDIASLNWKLFEYNESDIKKGKVIINLPNSSKLEDVRCWARGAEREGSIEIVDNKTISIEFKKIRDDMALELRVLSGTYNYPNVVSNNKVNANVLEDILKFEELQAKEDNMRITLSQIIHYGSFVLAVAMAFIFVHIYKKYDKEYTPEFTAEYLRELPDENLTPAEMSYLYYFGTINDEDCTATLLDLVRKKYLELDENGSGINDDNPNFRISLGINTNQALLKSHERYLINWFINEIGNGTSVTIEEIEGYPKTETRAKKFMECSATFAKLAKNEGKKHGFIEDVSKKGGAFAFVIIPVVYLIISLLLKSTYNLDITLALVLSFVLAISYLIYVGTIKKRTKFGAEEFAKWKAFKNFLTDFGQMEDYPMPGLIIWEKYLVYATSFKIADKVMAQLKVKLPNTDEETTENTWYDDRDTTYLRGYYRRRYYRTSFYYGRLNRTYSNAKQVGYKTIAAAEAKRSSGSGRGGGFSGGSSFGGGGGGGRSR